jgi:hypothetical protein
MKTTCYRVQPIGMELGSHRSQTSNDNADRGVHVFGSVSELTGGVQGWGHGTIEWQPEIVEIECEMRSLADNGDCEGYVLLGNKGTIINRKQFADFASLLEWASDWPETL